MKTAQEMRVNSVALIDGQPWLIQKAEFTKSGRNSAIVKMKLKNLLNGSKTETVYKADDKMEPVILERKEVNLSYISGEDYVFMDPEYNSYELRSEDLESVLPFIEEGMSDVADPNRIAHDEPFDCIRREGRGIGADDHVLLE